MKGKASPFAQFGAGLLYLLVVGSVLTLQAARPVLEGLPMDWSHRHVIFSQPSDAVSAALVAKDPRFWQQQYRRNALRSVRDDLAFSVHAENPDLRLANASLSTLARRDWSQDLGSGGSVGAGNYPAKFAFKATAANCASTAPPDYVVFGTGVTGAGKSGEHYRLR